MIISFPTQSGMITFCLNAALLKLIALALSVVGLLAGYAVVQMFLFVLQAPAEQFIRLVIFTVILTGIVVLLRFMFNFKKAGA